MQQREPSASESYFWPSVWAIGLHVLVFGLLFVSFAMTPELPPSKPIVQATLYQLKSKSQATTQTNQKIAGEAKKTASRQTEVEQMEQKKVEQEAVKAAEQKKADAAQKAEEAREAAEAKKAEDAAKAAEAKKAAEQKKAEEAKKQQADIAKKKAEDEAKAAEDKKAQALAELLSDTTERQQALADEQGDQVAGDFDDLIRMRAAEGWARPPSARKGMTVVLQINMLPDGTITNVSVAKSSGDGPFDSSAVAAVKNIGRLTEMQGLKPNEFNPYRSFKMTFTPEDLAL